MALTATVFLASLAVFDVLAVPLAAESATDMSSAFSSSVPSTYSDAGSSSSTLILGSAEAIATTTSSTVSSSGIDSQSSVPASSTNSQALSSASLSTTASPTDPLPTTITSTIFAIPPTVTVTGPAQTVTDTITIVPPPTPAPTVEQTAWSAPAQMTDLAAFNIRNFAFGQQNMRIIVNAPPPPPSANNGSADGTADAGADVSLESLTDAALAVASAVAAGLIPPPPAPLLADPSLPTDPGAPTPTNTSAPTLPTDPGARSFLQLFYPANSINPAQEPQGGADFYAAPLDLRAARNVSLAYSVFFPADFDWVQAGKLPGVYGGHEGCSGGDDALECFSTRLMWRENGQGELYLYAPKDKQTAALCETPPLSVCDADYGLSIGRGAFVFTPGDWTHVRQTVALNTPGQQDGAFALDVNGVRVIERSDVYYRGAPAAPDSGDQDPSSDEDTDESAVPGAVPANPLVPREDAQKTYAKGPFGPKVDSVLALNQTHAAPVDAEEFTPEFAPYAQYPPPGSSQDDGTEDAFTPAFAPPSAFPPGTRPNAVKFADPAASSSSEEGSSTATATCTTTVVPPPQTVTVYPTSTETAYTMAIESDDPSSLGAEAVASPTPIGFTGLFFSTFFGGHEAKYATPKDQFTWFKDFEMTINN